MAPTPLALLCLLVLLAGCQAPPPGATAPDSAAAATATPTAGAAHAAAGNATAARSPEVTQWKGDLAGAGADVPGRGPVFAGSFTPPGDVEVGKAATTLELELAWTSTAPQALYLTVKDPAGRTQTAHQSTPLAGSPVTLTVQAPAEGTWTAIADADGPAVQEYTITATVRY
ncbi:MAG: hypothetical protein LC623_05630 [Halobacteriales archaeon]|nr:hypothetical protein [Halobacteriales archaeon]